MEIRLVGESDLLKLSEIFSVAFTEADKAKPWTQIRAFNLLSYFYKHQPDLFFVAVNKGELVGGSALLIKPWREGNRCTGGISFVHPKHQKSGIGTKLFIKKLEVAIDKYQADSYESITFAAKEFPLTWYERIGLAHDKGAILIKGKTQEMLDRLRK